MGLEQRIAKLVELIKKDYDAIEDREGCTPLIRYAEYLADTPALKKEKKEVKNALLHMPKYFSAFSTKDIMCMLDFIYYSDFLEKHQQEIAETYAQALHQQPEIQVDKRAKIIVFVAKYNTAYKKSDLKKEVDIKEKHPWDWIQAMAHYDWNVAKIHTLEQIKKEKSLQTLNLILWFWKPKFLPYNTFVKFLREVKTIENVDSFRGYDYFGTFYSQFSQRQKN